MLAGSEMRYCATYRHGQLVGCCVSKIWWYTKREVPKNSWSATLFLENATGCGLRVWDSTTRLKYNCCCKTSGLLLFAPKNMWNV